MKETIRLALILFLVAAVSAGILAFANELTAPIIAEIEREGSFGAIADMFQDADDFQPLEDEIMNEILANNNFVQEVTKALKGDEVIGYGFKVKSVGYGGDIISLIGINTEGRIVGFTVLQMSETAGLGSRIADDPAFAESFVGKSATEKLVPVASPSADNEFLALSGATVSTSAVQAAVNGAVDAFVNYLSK
ncbi:MAG: FMN-binding protein [Tissierellales bacterium]|nr:FMN-binding protein [Tissierellales bacterium]